MQERFICWSLTIGWLAELLNCRDLDLLNIIRKDRVERIYLQGDVSLFSLQAGSPDKYLDSSDEPRIPHFCRSSKTWFEFISWACWLTWICWQLISQSGITYKQRLRTTSRLWSLYIIHIVVNSSITNEKTPNILFLCQFCLIWHVIAVSYN